MGWTRLRICIQCLSICGGRRCRSRSRRYRAHVHRCRDLCRPVQPRFPEHATPLQEPPICAVSGRRSEGRFLPDRRLSLSRVLLDFPGDFHRQETPRLHQRRTLHALPNLRRRRSVVVLHRQLEQFRETRCQHLRPVATNRGGALTAIWSLPVRADAMRVAEPKASWKLALRHHGGYRTD